MDHFTEYIDTSPQRRYWNFLGLRGGVRGSLRLKKLKKCMKIKRNFQRGGKGILDEIFINPLCGVGMDIFLNCTLQLKLP